jgi:hypothetical protein
VLAAFVVNRIEARGKMPEHTPPVQGSSFVYPGRLPGALTPTDRRELPLESAN